MAHAYSAFAPGSAPREDGVGDGAGTVEPRLERPGTSQIATGESAATRLGGFPHDLGDAAHEGDAGLSSARLDAGGYTAWPSASGAAPATVGESCGGYTAWPPKTKKADATSRMTPEHYSLSRTGAAKEASKERPLGKDPGLAYSPLEIGGPVHEGPRDSCEITRSTSTTSVDKPLDLRDLDSRTDERQYQMLVESIQNDSGIHTNWSAYQRLAAMMQDFAHAATMWGRAIIAEKHLPVHRKTIKPATGVGGIAGGEKYVAGGIFFRFPANKHNLYGSEDLAAKEANHQMKGLTALYNGAIQGLSLPMLAVIKYRGIKVVAMSIVPIQGAETLCYGSSDAGRNVAGEFDEQVQALMERAARVLNLAKHPVQPFKDQPPVEMCMPCDLEVHRVHVKDGVERHYVVDFARLFPPQPPAPVLKALLNEAFGPGHFELPRPSARGGKRASCRGAGAHLSFLLRPELVRRSPTPLSSDAFSRFQAPGSEAFQEDVVQAARGLFFKVIPATARKMAKLRPKPAGPDLVRAMHSDGINMRFLGLVFASTNNVYLRESVLSEAVARVVKAVLRGRMRLVATSAQSSFMEATAEILNRFCGRTTCSAPLTTTNSAACTHACACECRRAGGTCAAQALAMFDLEAAREEHPVDADELPELLEEVERHQLWCTRLPGLLHERYFFARGKLREDVVAVADMRLRKAGAAAEGVAVRAPRGLDTPPCRCCSCVWTQALDPASLLRRVRDMCGVVLSHAAEARVADAEARLKTQGVACSGVSRFVLRRSCSDGGDSVGVGSLQSNGSHGMGSAASTETLQEGLQAKTCFDVAQIFEAGDIADVAGTTHVLPVMEYTRGTDLMIRGNRRLSQGHREEGKRLALEALDTFQSGLRRSPNDAMLLCHTGSLHETLYTTFKIGSITSGFALHLQSVKANPTHARGWHRLAISLAMWFEELGCKAKGVAAFVRMAFAALGNELEKELDTSLKMGRKTDPEVLKAMRLVHYFYRRAIATAVSPAMSAQVLSAMAKLMWHTFNDRQAALALFHKSLEARPDHYKSLVNLARLQRELGDWVAAADTVARVVSSPDATPEMHLEMAICHLALLDVLDGEPPSMSEKGDQEDRRQRGKEVKKESQGKPVRETLEERLERARAVRSSVVRALSILEDFRLLTVERGEKSGRIFDVLEPDVHAARTMRASRALLEIGRRMEMYCLRHRSRTDAPEHREGTALLASGMWQCFAAARDLLLIDPLFAQMLRQTTHKWGTTEIRMRKQLTQAKLNYAKALMRSVLPDLVVPSRRNELDMLEGQPRLRISDLEDTESRERLILAAQLLEDVCGDVRGEDSAGAVTAKLFQLHFELPESMRGALDMALIVPRKSVHVLGSDQGGALGLMRRVAQHGVELGFDHAALTGEKSIGGAPLAYLFSDGLGSAFLQVRGDAFRSVPALCAAVILESKVGLPTFEKGLTVSADYAGMYRPRKAFLQQVPVADLAASSGEEEGPVELWDHMVLCCKLYRWARSAGFKGALPAHHLFSDRKGKLHHTALVFSQETPVRVCELQLDERNT